MHTRWKKLRHKQGGSHQGTTPKLTQRLKVLQTKKKKREMDILFVASPYWLTSIPTFSLSLSLCLSLYHRNLTSTSRKKQLFPGQTQFSPAPYLCPPPACVADWSSDVSPPDGSECAPQCSLLEGEGQAQLKTHKAPGTGSPDRMMEEEGRRSRAEQNKTHINEWWRDVMEKQWLCTIRQ